MLTAKRYSAEFASEIICDKDGPVTIVSMSGSLTAATANQNLVTGVAGKKIRVLSMNFYSGAAATSTVFLHSSGGAAHFNDLIPSNAVAPFSKTFAENRSGWVNTTVGESLQADAGASIVVYSITYYLYTP